MDELTRSLNRERYDSVRTSKNVTNVFLLVGRAEQGVEREAIAEMSSGLTMNANEAEIVVEGWPTGVLCATSGFGSGAAMRPSRMARCSMALRFRARLSASIPLPSVLVNQRQQLVIRGLPLFD